MLKLKPTLKSYIWGGKKLKTLFGRVSDQETLSESWEVSVHKDGDSLLENGMTLSRFINENPTAVDKEGSEFPVLIKFIDSAQNLSVQVHPDDEYSRRVEGDNGKTEMWYVMSADEGAGIYCGFKEDVEKARFLEKVKNGAVEELLNFIPVKKGDCFLIEAGTVHAILKGCFICEVQQSSNVTYRVYDYNRVGADGKTRPLHLEKSLDVINFKKFEDHTDRGEREKIQGGEIEKLTECKYFKCRALYLNGEFRELNDLSFTAINVVEGEGEIDGESFKIGDSFFIERGKEFSVKGNATLILTAKNL